MNDYTPLTDQEHEKFSELWNQNHGFLHGMARRILPSRDPSESLSDLADAFVRLRLITKLKPDYDPEAFRGLAVGALRIIWFRWRSRCAKDKARILKWRHTAQPRLATPPDAEATAERNEAIETVLQHAELLTEKQRDAVIAHFLRNESIPDIADRWGCQHARNPENVLRRGLQSLLKLLSESPDVDPGGSSKSDQKKRMKRMREAGCSWGQIAARTGFSSGYAWKAVTMGKLDSPDMEDDN